MARLDGDTLGAVAAVVDGNQEEFVAAFYATLLRNPETAPFLSHTIVDERLKHSLRKWLCRFPIRARFRVSRNQAAEICTRRLRRA
jgi:hypothetical protein